MLIKSKSDEQKHYEQTVARQFGVADSEHGERREMAECIARKTQEAVKLGRSME